jgi:hypothetical protein
MNSQIKFGLLLFLLLIPLTTLAQTFEPLVGIPGATDGGGDLSAYLNAIYRISISLAALLAVLVLIKAGVKYMFSDIVTDKASAKSDIRGAILGLLLIISAVLILSTINENITNFSISIAPIEVPPQEDRPILPGEGGVITNTLCDDAESGGCELHSCQVLLDEIVTYAGVGCAVGGTAGAVYGSVGGSTIPILGNIAGFFVGGVVGCVGGAITGSLAGSVADEAFCIAGCNLAGGTYITEGPSAGHCATPRDSELFRRVELRRVLEEIDSSRAETMAEIASNNPVPLADFFTYFDNLDGVDPENFDYITADRGMIPISDQAIIFQTLGLDSPQVLRDLIEEGGVRMVPLVRNGVPLNDIYNNESEYLRMIANVETTMRGRCDSTVRVTEDVSPTIIGTALVYTRIYCIGSGA